MARAGTRAAAAAGSQTHNLLDLPDTALQHILLTASGGGRFGELRHARRACKRLRSAAKAAVREVALRLECWEGATTQLSQLPRLGSFTRVHLLPNYNAADYMGSCDDDDVVLTMRVANALYQHCRGTLTDLWVGGSVGAVRNLACALGLLAANNHAGTPLQLTLPPPPPPLPAGLSGGAAALCALPLLTSLSLAWEGKLRVRLAPLARLTGLTALALSGCATGVSEADWLPPNLQELHLEPGDEADFMRLRGVGGAGWLAALHDGACPKIRALRLNQLAVRDFRPAGRPDATLASTLPRLTALEELVVTAFESNDRKDYWVEFEDGDSEGSSDEEETEYLPPIAPLLAALPSLRYCRLMFKRMSHDEDMHGSLKHCCKQIPMLLATPAELASLRAPRLESLAVGLVASNSGQKCFCFCQSEPAANAAIVSAGAAAAAGSSVSSSSLPALRSLELFVGCCRAAGGYGSVWDLAALAPGSLPALRRLLVLPTLFACFKSKLPLDAVARAAPGLQRLVIDPRCAGPLDALFCDGGGCALSLRSVMLLPPAANNAASAPVCIDAELRAGLSTRAGVATRAGLFVPALTVTLFGSDMDPRPGPAWLAICPYMAGVAFMLLPFDSLEFPANTVRTLFEDGRYVQHFLHTGLRRGSLPDNAREDTFVDDYERQNA